MNDFPVSLGLISGAGDHELNCDIRFTGEAPREAVAAVEQILRSFAAACSLGMLSGRLLDPVLARMVRFDFTQQTPGLALCRLRLSGVSSSSVRVLVGMLRGNPFLDGVLGEVVLRMESIASTPAMQQLVTDERSIPLSDLLGGEWNFPVEADDNPNAAISLIRARFRKPVPPDVVADLIAVQDAWRSVCSGGLAENAKPAYEYFVSSPDGYLISPCVFEIPIDVFENSSSSVDLLVRGLERLDKLRWPVELVHIY